MNLAEPQTQINLLRQQVVSLRQALEQSRRENSVLRQKLDAPARRFFGKKNWLFLGSEEAGQRSAVIYTLIENCRRHGVEPHTHLKDVLERLPRTTNQEVGPPTPENWPKVRQHQVKLAP